MRTTLSASLQKNAEDAIADEELLRRSRNANALRKKGKLPKLASLAEMIDLAEYPLQIPDNRITEY